MSSVRGGGLRRSWPVVLAVTLTLALAAATLGTSAGRRALTAGALAAELMSPAPGLLSLSTPSPRVDRLEINAGGRDVQATVYRPGREGRHGGVVLAMGLRAWPLDDPRLERLAGSLARANIVVMAVESPGLRYDQVRVRDVEDLVAAFERLRLLPYVDPLRAGFLGVSAGGSLALVAAADPRIAEQVAFVESVGAYFDSRALLRAATVAGDGWEPDAESARLIFKQVIDAASDGRDRAVLNGIFYFGRSQDASLVGGLSEQGRALLALLENRAAERFDALFAAAGLDKNQDFLQLSPSESIDSVQARVRVLHSRRDTHVPLQQGRDLRLASGGTLLAFDAFDHVDPRRSGRTAGLAADALRLHAYLFGLLRRLG